MEKEDTVPLYCQVQWENDIIWTPEDAERGTKKPVTGARADKEKLAGWVPKTGYRGEDRLSINLENNDNKETLEIV